MKKTIVLTVILCLAARVFAANPTEFMHLFCDFESPTTLPALQFHAPDGGGTVSIVEDPVNSLNHVLKVVTPAGDNWGGCIFNEVSKGETFMNTLYGVPAITGYDCVVISMYREDNTHVPQLKTVDIDDDGHMDVSYLDLKPLSVHGDKNYEANGTIKTGEWQEYEFNVTHCHNSGIKFIYIMPDRQGQSTVYIDDITFIKDNEKPTMGTATCGTSTDGSISLQVTATDNMSDPVNHYYVSTDGTFANATDYLATSGVLTITGLNASTEYTFTIWAKDYAGNVSDNSVTCTCSTTEAQAGNNCHQLLTSSGYTIYISCEKSAANTYVLTIESGVAMSGLTPGCYCHVNGSTAYSYGSSGNYTVSDGGKKITCTISSTTDPNFYTPLYIMMPGEVQFTMPTGIIWGKCSTAEPCVAPNGGSITYPNLSYNYGAVPWAIEFDYPCTGTNLQYQWYTNTTGVIDASDTPYTGPGNNTPSCLPSTTEPVGNRTYYYCKIWNDCGEIYSTIANVDIVNCTWDGTMSVSAPSSVVEGTTLTLTMNYTGYGGVKTICWYYNGVQIWCDPVDTLFNQSVLIIDPCSLENSGSYYCTMQDGTNCTMTSPTKTVTVTPGTPPTPTTITHPTETHCIGDVVTLTGGNIGPWTWNTGATTQTITANTTAEGTTTYTCTTATQIDIYTIVVKDCTPPTPEPCQELIYSKWNDVLFINNADSIFVAYQWYRDGQKLEGETRQFYYTHGDSMDGDGHVYSAFAFKADGSSVEACGKAFNAFTRSADQNPGEKRNVQVYPNPVQRNMPVRIIGLGDQLSLMIYSATGQRIAQYSGDTFVPNLPAGCYLLYATDGENEPYCQTLIVQ